MRNIFVLGFLMMAVALCNGDSDAGSGDVVVITPTNKSAPPTDATNDSGSGVDDEDDDDDGSTTDVPTKVATTVNLVTTTSTSTKATTTIPATTPGGDDDEAEGSGGSGSGFPSTVATKDKSEPATDSTDIYISEGTTKMVTNPPKSTFESTVKTTNDSQSLPTTSSTDSKTVVYDTTTETPVVKVRSTTASVKTTGSQDVSTRRPTTKSTTRASTTNSDVDAMPPTQRKNKITKPEDKTKEPATEMPKTKQPSPSTPLVKESTTAKDVNALASNQKKSGEGFTLTTEVIAGVVGCALLALLFIAFLMYRLKKRDEGSYLLDDSCGHADAYKKVDNSDKEAFV